MDCADDEMCVICTVENVRRLCPQKYTKRLTVQSLNKMLVCLYN